jgi:hypothetical protein
MGENVAILVRSVLPKVFRDLGYAEDDVITIVSFSTKTHVNKYKVSELETSGLVKRNATHMTPGLTELERIITSSSSTNIRLLTISDGQLHDQEKAATYASSMATRLTGKYNISSKAVLFFTSTAHPDTRGLSSVLQFNASQDIALHSISAANKASAVANEISGLMESDMFVSAKLTTSESNLLITPWNTPVNSLNLVNGVNTFWLNNIPDEIKLNDETVDIEVGDKLDYSSLGTVLKGKVDHFMNQIKVLKVVNTVEANAEIANIMSYFKQLEKSFASMEVDLATLLEDRGLNARMRYFKELVKKKNSSVVLRMAELANDDKVGKLNAAQQASYLRQADVSSSSKNLAKRAMKSGLNFAEIAIAEVKEMAKHLSELDGIDDDDHYESFYSRCTTLEGIKSLCELVDDENTIDEMSELDILQMINIVGIPCEGPVGDYTDPMLYRIKEIFLGTFVSISDILVNKEMGHDLKDPFHHKVITNVIPVFDDARIHEFLIKYAPTIVEYSASIGMRNQVLCVPHTHKYIICGGAWNMVERINTDKSDASVKAFIKLIQTYEVAVGGLFAHVMDFIKDQDDVLSYYIGNNGITNMISPMIMMARSDQTKGTNYKQYVPRILSALYSFEMYQGTRKIFRGDDAHTKKLELLNELVSISYSKHGTKLPEYFEKDDSPVFHDGYEINMTYMTQIMKRVWYLDYVTLLYPLIEAAVANDVDAIKALPKVDDEFVTKQLGLTFDLDQFRFYCAVQSLIYDSKVSRVDDDGKKMKFVDCANETYAENMVKLHVQKQYKNRYASDMAGRGKEEHKMLSEELVATMLKVETTEEFIKLFKEGLTRNHVHEKIENTYKLGYAQLREEIFKPGVTNHKEKLYVFLMAHDRDGNVVWNGGNPVRFSMSTLAELFTNLGFGSFWESIKDEYFSYNMHTYRASDMPNRHTHCNSKVSFWAKNPDKYNTVETYFADISAEEREEYIKEHPDCCGVGRWLRHHGRPDGKAPIKEKKSEYAGY